MVLINTEGNAAHFTKSYASQVIINEVTESIFEPRIQLKGAIPEIDLHMEELLPNNRLKKGESALLFQLQYCRKVIQKASIARTRKLVFIHGMGSGILRDELRNMLRNEYPHSVSNKCKDLRLMLSWRFKPEYSWKEAIEICKDLKLI